MYATAFIEHPLCARHCAEPHRDRQQADAAPALGLLGIIVKAVTQPVRQPQPSRLLVFAAPFPTPAVQTLLPSPGPAARPFLQNRCPLPCLPHPIPQVCRKASTHLCCLVSHSVQAAIQKTADGTAQATETSVLQSGGHTSKLEALAGLTSFGASPRLAVVSLLLVPPEVS